MDGQSRQKRELKDMIAVITGAGSGVGAVVARELAAQDMRVILVGRTETKLSRVAQDIRAADGTAEIFACDVSDPRQVNSLREHVISHLGPPHILFNGAGLHCELVPIHQTTPERWIETFQTNTIGPYLICRAFLREMLQQGWGRIINVSSAASLGEPNNISAVYQLSKLALNHFTRQLAKEVAGSGVTANVIHPGEVKTEMWAAIKAEASSRSGPGRNSLRWVEMVEESGGDPPERTAELVLELLRPASDGINGQFLWIKDGIKKPMPTW